MFIYIAVMTIASIIVFKEGPTSFGQGAWVAIRTICYSLTLLLFLNAFIVSCVPMYTTEVKYHGTTNSFVNNVNGEKIYFFNDENGGLQAVSIDKSKIRYDGWVTQPFLVETHKEYKSFLIKSILLKEYEEKIEYEVIEISLY